MIYIEAIRMDGYGTSHEHIAEVQWRDSSDNQTGHTARQAMVDWIRSGNQARVTDGRTEVQVGVVDATPAYLRTHADGQWTNNLLALPRY